MLSTRKDHLLSICYRRRSKKIPSCGLTRFRQIIKGGLKNLPTLFECFFVNNHHQFHDRQNLKGQLSTEPFNGLQNPYPGLHHLLNQTLNKVPSLACLAAVAVRICNVGYEELPVTLQRFVDQH